MYFISIFGGLGIEENNKLLVFVFVLQILFKNVDKKVEKKEGDTLYNYN